MPYGEPKLHKDHVPIPDTGRKDTGCKIMIRGEGSTRNANSAHLGGGPQRFDAMNSSNYYPLSPSCWSPTGGHGAPPPPLHPLVPPSGGPGALDRGPLGSPTASYLQQYFQFSPLSKGGSPSHHSLSSGGSSGMQSTSMASISSGFCNPFHSYRSPTKPEEGAGEPLHVLIQCEDTPNRARIRLDVAKNLITKLFQPVDDAHDELKQKQLPELSLMNGMFKAWSTPERTATLRIVVQAKSPGQKPAAKQKITVPAASSSSSKHKSIPETMHKHSGADFDAGAKQADFEIPIDEPQRTPPIVTPTAPMEDKSGETPDRRPKGGGDEQPASSDEADPMEVFKDGSIHVFIRAYEKRGEGINAYLVYKIETRVHNIPGYQKSIYEVWRRFSDFLGLREKLVDRFQHQGVVVPMAPEKSVKAMTKTKLNTANDEHYTSDVAEKRTRQLERFLRRLTRSPRLVTNHDLIDFLSFEGNLPHASSTSALSSSSVKKMFKSFSEMLSKIAFPMDENDRWFEHVHGHIEELEEMLTRLQTSGDGLTGNRRELAAATDQLSKALQMIASCEENTALARTLSKLAETHENLAVIHKHEADMDAQLTEVVHEHVQLAQVLKELFYERQTNQQSLTKKRETKARFDLAGNAERARQMKTEVDEQEQRVDEMEKTFQSMSKLIRSEYAYVSDERRKDLKAAFIDRLESLAESEQQVLDHWQKFAPEIKNTIN
ncbi:Sorting nexin-2 [Aphelenchoides fujianensis]|nr:Sorting nexin-2 [Aphelenchoides fujianensis]